jgi:hypothetical protein
MYKDEPTQYFTTPRGPMVVTNNKRQYLHWYKRIVAFSWPEMGRILDAAPDPVDLDWAFQIKTDVPGVRIESLGRRIVTYPGEKAPRKAE